MARIKGGVRTRAKHKKILKLAKGYRMTRHKQIKKAKEAILHAGEYAYAGRKRKKRDMRTLWITRINAAVSPHHIRYSQFIAALHQKNIHLDRKIMAYLAANYPKAFEKIVSQVLPPNL